MFSPAKHGWWALLLLLACSVVAAPLQPGATRDEVISAYGVPTGIVATGGREVFTYPEGKIVLENGRITQTTVTIEPLPPQEKERRAAPKPSEPTLAPNVKKSRAAITVTPSRDNLWLTSLDDAQAQASREQKRILTLFWSVDSSYPWAPVFNRTVVYNGALLRELAQDFVLLKVNYPPKVSDSPTAEEMERVQAIEAFRQRTIGREPLPAMAIVSSDGRRSAPVDLSSATTAQSRMANYVRDAIAAAKDEPLRGNVPFSPKLVIVAFVGVIALVWLLRQ